MARRPKKLNARKQRVAWVRDQNNPNRTGSGTSSLVPTGSGSSSSTSGSGSGSGTRPRPGRFQRLVKQGSKNIKQAAAQARDFFGDLIDIQMGRAKPDEQGPLDLGRKAFRRHFNANPGAALSRDQYNNFKRRAGNKNYKHDRGFFHIQHIGKLFMYSYDAKWKRELKYFDRLPLMLLMQFDATHFLGLNFHYLPPMARAQLLDAIVDNELKDRRFDDRNDARIPFSYQIMKRAAGSRLYKPCVKQYVFKGPGGKMGRGVVSQFLQIPGEDWHNVLFMPWEKFVTGGSYEQISKEKVWRDSMKRR